MPDNLSSKEDKSSILYEGRAELSSIGDIPGMDINGWKERLGKAIEATDRSMRDISLAAGLGPGYLHSILVEGKEPTISKLAKICEAADFSLYQILVGIKITKDDEELLKLLARTDDPVKESILTLLREGRKRAKA